MADYNAEICPRCGHAFATADIKQGNQIKVTIKKAKDNCSICKRGRNIEP